MKPAAFDYATPTDLDEVVGLLTRHGDGAKLLAGGQSLLPLMNLRLSAPSVLVDLQRVPGLTGTELADGVVSMGAMTRHADALSSPITRRHLPVLAEALRWVGHTAIRNAGTVGGSLAHADPAAELLLILTLLDGEVVLHGPDGRRTVPATDLFLGYFTTAMSEREVLVEVRWPVPTTRGWGFHEVARRHGDFCIVSAAALLDVDTSRRITDARIALGGVADRVVRAREAEEQAIGHTAGAAAFDAIARAAAAGVDPHGDVHGSAAYRRQLVHVLVRRALDDALARLEED